MCKKLVLILSAFFSLNIRAAEVPATANKTITLVTHEAAPWMAEKLPDQGAIFYALRKLLKKKNYDLKVVFAPSWIRAKLEAIKDPKIDGYAPIRTIEYEDEFWFTEVLFESPWSIAERVSNPIHFKELDDLLRYTAGNVQGVELRPGIEELTHRGLKIETTSTQANNLLKLATRRVDFVFIDKGVYRYTMASEPALQRYRKKLQLNPKVIVMERYKLALKKKNVPEDLVPFFNASYAEFNSYLEEYYSQLEAGKF